MNIITPKITNQYPSLLTTMMITIDADIDDNIYDDDDDDIHADNDDDIYIDYDDDIYDDGDDIYAHMMTFTIIMMMAFMMMMMMTHISDPLALLVGAPHIPNAVSIAGRMLWGGNIWIGTNEFG